MTQPREVHDPDRAARPRAGVRNRLQAPARDLFCRQVVDREHAADNVDALGEVRVERGDVAVAQLHAVGCLTRCIVEEITKAGRACSSRSSRKDKKEGS